MKYLLSRKEKMTELFILAFITIFGIGSQFFTNLSYSLNQGVIQTSFGIGSKDLVIPAIIGNFAFAAGTPLGHTFSHRLSFKRSYMLFISLFLLGSVIGLISFNLPVITIAKTIQGFSSGVLFFILLPKLFKSFPKRFRNIFLFMIIVGMFGANALGGLSGSFSVELNEWKWIFLTNVIASILCLILGAFYLKRQEYYVKETHLVDWAVIVHSSIGIIAMTIPMVILVHNGLSTIWFWISIAFAVIYIIIFLAANSRSLYPIMHFKSLLSIKPFFGAIMAISTHLTLLTAIAGINIFLLKILRTPFEINAKFYAFFFVGVIIAATIKMLFFDKLGAGILGVFGAVSILYVSVHWIILRDTVNLPLLYTQGALLGFGASMTLVSGSMATLLDGDLDEAPDRARTMHSIRNLFAALLVPVISFITKANVHNGVEELKSQNITSKAEFLTKFQDVAIYAGHVVFYLMIFFNIIMLISSIIQIILGKGRRITPKPN
ncbi:MFS transporter, DHA2 family, multidrug resistance protein [Staphylococcus auricularis]